jgi:DNA-binding transcriptional regulator YiaG
MSTQNVDVDDYFRRCYRFPMTMTPEQCRAARAWLDLSQDDLAAAAHVSQSTVRDFEKGRRVPVANNLAAIRTALEARGIGFVGTVDNDASGITFTRPAPTPN